MWSRLRRFRMLVVLSSSTLLLCPFVAGATPVAVCADTTPPVQGAPYSSCTNVVWISDGSIQTLSRQEIFDLASAAFALFAIASVFKLLTRTLRRS